MQQMTVSETIRLHCCTCTESPTCAHCSSPGWSSHSPCGNLRVAMPCINVYELQLTCSFLLGTCVTVAAAGMAAAAETCAQHYCIDDVLSTYPCQPRGWLHGKVLTALHGTRAVAVVAFHMPTDTWCLLSAAHVLRLYLFTVAGQQPGLHLLALLLLLYVCMCLTLCRPCCSALQCTAQRQRLQ